jgi:aminoglycoside phosphotransferase (APT) family kinase protein
VNPLNTESLARWLDTRDVATGEPVDASCISGGTSNDIFAITRGDRRLVLRKPPEKVPPGRNETMLREYRVLKALNGTDVPHPEAVAVCDDTDVLGSCSVGGHGQDGVHLAHEDPISTSRSVAGSPQPYAVTTLTQSPQSQMILKVRPKLRQ